MKFMDKVWNSLGLVEATEDEKDKPAEREERPRRASNGNTVGNVVNLPNAQQKQQFRVMVIEPSSFNDAQDIADHLKNRKPVVINFEKTDQEVAKRMIDFISGTTYALNGRIQNVGNKIFLCAPNNVDVAYGERGESGDKPVFHWADQ